MFYELKKEKDHHVKIKELLINLRQQSLRKFLELGMHFWIANFAQA